MTIYNYKKKILIFLKSNIFVFDFCLTEVFQFFWKSQIILSLKEVVMDSMTITVHQRKPLRLKRSFEKIVALKF